MGHNPATPIDLMVMEARSIAEVGIEVTLVCVCLFQCVSLLVVVESLCQSARRSVVTGKERLYAN